MDASERHSYIYIYLRKIARSSGPQVLWRKLGSGKTRDSLPLDWLFRESMKNRGIQ